MTIKQLLNPLHNATKKRSKIKNLNVKQKSNKEIDMEDTWTTKKNFNHARARSSAHNARTCMVHKLTTRKTKFN